MAKKTWTAQELEALSQSEQDAIFQESIVRDLEAAPQDFLARIRERFEGHITESSTTS